MCYADAESKRLLNVKAVFYKDGLIIYFIHMLAIQSRHETIRQCGMNHEFPTFIFFSFFDQIDTNTVSKKKISQSISIEECYSILFYHPKKLLYQLYHTILQYTLHPKTLLFYFFIKILFFLIFLYYFFHIITFFQLRSGIKYIYIYIYIYILAQCYSTILSCTVALLQKILQ